MKTAWFAGLVMAAVGAAWGCADDEDPGGTGGGAGSGGGAGTAGAGASAGTDGGAGSSGSGGSSGGGGSSGASGAGGAAPARLLVAGTDFASATEIATIDLDGDQLIGSVTVNDGDAVPAASGGRGFVLERTNDVVHVLGADGKLAQSIDVGGGDAGVPANPTGVVAIGDQAWVTLYGQNAIAVLDLASGDKSSELDLSAFHQASDADGVVDVGTPIHDPASNRVYFTLARIDRTTIAPPDFQLACPTQPSLLLAIDAGTGALVDLNGAASGEAIELALKNPVDVAIEDGRLLVLSAGCFASGARTGHGVEAVDLASGATSVALTPADESFFARMLLVGTNAALINRFDPTFAEYWSLWTTTETTLGADIDGIPAAPSYDGAGYLLGVVVESTDGGASVRVVRHAMNGGAKTTVVENPWTGPYTTAIGTAIVKP